MAAVPGHPSPTSAVIVRGETPLDRAGIAEVTRLAFGGEAEVRLIERIRAGKDFDPRLSLVATNDAGIVGHILFSPIVIESMSAQGRSGDAVTALALAPMAVHPRFQRRGIGSRLVREGLKACRQCGHDVVVVVGHPEFYPRFGFVRGSQHAIRAPFPVPDEAFLVLRLRCDALRGISGVVRYSPAFDEV